MASDLACCVAGGQYGSCTGVGSWAVMGVFPLLLVNMVESLFMMCIVQCAMIMLVGADRMFI